MNDQRHTGRYLIALALALSLCACGSKTVDPDTETKPNSISTPPSPTSTHAPTTTVPPIDVTTTPPPVVTTAPITTDVLTTPVAPAAMGSFSSTTGSNLEIHLDWSVLSQTDRAVTLRAEAYITCYTISVSARHGGVLKIGNSSQSFSTEAIVNDASGKQTYSLATATVDLPLSADGTATVDMSVSWPFLGSYSGVSIDHLACGGSITVGTPHAVSTTASTTLQAITTAPTEPAQTPLLEQGKSILFKSTVFTDRTAQHWNSVTLLQNRTELDRLLAAHSTTCTNSTCAAIAAALAAYDDTFFAGKVLLLIPQGNLYSTTSPVEVFDIRADDGAIYVHIRDIAPSRNVQPLLTTRFYLQIVELPADELTGRTLCVVQHGTFYTDAGKYERDYLREAGTPTEPTVRAYLPAAIAP